MKKQIRIKPEGWIKTIVFGEGFSRCGRADNGIHIYLNDEAGGVLTNRDIWRLIKAFENHLKEAKKRPRHYYKRKRINKSKQV